MTIVDRRVIYGGPGLTANDVLACAAQTTGEPRTHERTLLEATRQIAMEPELILANREEYDRGFTVAARMSAFCCDVVELWIKERGESK